MMVDDNILKLDTVDPAFIQLLDQPVGPYDVEHQIETFASFDGHVIIQTMFLSGEYRGKSLDNTGEEYVGPWLAALERIRPQETTIYTVARETPVAGLAKAAPEALDTIAARVRALGIPLPGELLAKPRSSQCPPSRPISCGDIVPICAVKPLKSELYHRNFYRRVGGLY